MLQCCGLTPSGSYVLHSCSLTPPQWDGEENQKGKRRKLVGWDKDGLIGKAKAARESEAE